MDCNIKKLIENIISIEDKNGNIINYQKIDVKLVSSKYSNTKIPIYKLELDDKLISRNNSFIISYKCLECQRENKVSLNNIVRKINKSIWKCRICKEYDELKRNNHSEIMTNPDYVKKEIIKTSLEEFNNMDSDFIDKYFLKHLTIDEFEYLKKHIISFNNGNNILDMEYIPTFKCNNQTLFTPIFYNSKKDVFEKPIYIMYKCQNCQCEFTNRDLWVQKNRIKILCKDCSFCNDTFKIRTTTNIHGDKIKYQSKFELKFIKFCSDNQILVVNGPKLDYYINNKIRKYIVDYYLPELKILVELKDEHIWHKKQIENGIWKLKLDSVEKYNLENNTIYLLIFPKNYQHSLKLILQKNNT
jgi:hypothetical protein